MTRPAEQYAASPAADIARSWRYTLGWVLIIGGYLAFSSPAMAETPARGEPSDGQASFSVGVFSNLVWRGQELNTGASIQPMVDLSEGGFGINIWSNFDVDKDYIRETDITMNYAGGRDKLGYDVGFIYYGLVNPTFELYATLKYDAFLSPYATFYLDVDAGQGGFLMFGIGHPLAVTDDIDVQLGAYASINFENRAMGVDQNGETFTDFYNMDFSAKTSIPIGRAWSFDMQLAYSFALSEAAKSGISSAAATGKHNTFYGGVGVSRPF